MLTRQASKTRKERIIFQIIIKKIEDILLTLLRLDVKE